MGVGRKLDERKNVEHVAMVVSEEGMMMERGCQQIVLRRRYERGRLLMKSRVEAVVTRCRVAAKGNR